MNAVARRALGLTPLPVRTLLRRLTLPRAVARFVPSELAILRRLVQPGDLVLDVGANVGWYTRTLSHLVGPTGHVIAIEPVPSTAWLLRQNVRTFGWSNVSVVSGAVSNACGTVTVRVPTVGGYDDIYGPSVDAVSGRGYRVPMHTLDSLVAGRAVGFVKIDVEGHEWPVIQGAPATLRASGPALLIELTRNPVLRVGSGSQRLAQALAAEGYAPYWSREGRLASWQVHEWPPSSNFLFLRPEHLARAQ
jgi:FkbM family methyltransferase